MKDMKMIGSGQHGIVTGKSHLANIQFNVRVYRKKSKLGPDPPADCGGRHLDKNDISDLVSELRCVPGPFFTDIHMAMDQQEWRAELAENCFPCIKLLDH
ncbi:hypothetical protein DUI87_17045 [Hirundo rustica rustica]|uniref:Uncharacterized protein n=1 Tax=Hirundo rustica rustica TaxID=333673 RepID=A0A3M0K508_HIRRU|nr:hypothetical protein DUI87_17045 [Hirundo rustica rustica]